MSRQAIQPALLDSYDRAGGAKKSLSISRGCLRPSVIGNPRAITRQQVIAQPLVVHCPDDGIGGVLRGSGLESTDARLFADMKEHEMSHVRQEQS
jgi:hypothetical protein